MFAAGVVAASLAVVLTGCGGADPAAPAPQAVALVVGHRANAVAVPWAALTDHLPQEHAAGTRIAVVGVDGSPDGAPLLDAAMGDASSSYDAKDDFLTTLGRAKRAVDGARAAEGEADVLGAIGAAARAVSRSPGTCTLVVADSMLSTAGVLPFQNGYLDAAPEDVAESLQGTALPDLTGCGVVVVGAGQTAAPQAPLGERAQQNLRAVWQAVLEASGAKGVDWDDTIIGEGAVAEAPAVTAVDVTPVQAPVLAQACTVVLHQDQVSFIPDSATFADPTSAEEVIAEAAEQLAGCPGRVTLTGTTSSAGTPEGRQATSRARAEAVRDVLAGHRGVSASEVDVVAAGADFPGFVADRAADGQLMPGPAAQNRTVRISVTG